jgi:hypothetical protein
MDLQALIAQYLGPDAAQGGLKDLLTQKIAEGGQSPDELVAFLKEKTGIDEAKLMEFIPALGANGMLGGLVAKLDADGDGSVLDDAAGLLGGLFRK